MQLTGVNSQSLPPVDTYATSRRVQSISPAGRYLCNKQACTVNLSRR